MPEGDTLHTIARYLDRTLMGRIVVNGRLWNRPDVTLARVRVTSIDVHGKHLMIEFDDAWIVRSHLGLHGSWHRYALGEPWRRPEHRASLVLTTERDVFVCFAAREVELLRKGGVRARSHRARLGPDLLAPDWDRNEVRRRTAALTEDATPVVDLLLDQRVASGIGNVYKSEVLFLGGISPDRRTGSLPAAEIESLFERAAALMSVNVDGGPRITRPGPFRDGPRSGGLWVYGRRDRPCWHCETPIRSAVMGRGQRITYWCPSCQR